MALVDNGALLDRAGLTFQFHIYEHGKFKFNKIRGLVDSHWIVNESHNFDTTAHKQTGIFKVFQFKWFNS